MDYSTLLTKLRDNDSKVKLLVELRDWFNRILEFDAKTGEPLSDDLTHFLDKIYEISQSNKDKNVYDWIHNILSYSGNAFLHIFDSPRKEILRSHELMPLYQAKEIDTVGIMDISRREGRTVREKIAVKPSVIAVKRQQSIDTQENRLFKKLIKKLTYILEERQNIYSELNMENDDSTLACLYAKLCLWLKSDEAHEIGNLQNTQSNSSLLYDKFYKKIWKTWRYIGRLDDYVNDDYESINNIIAAYIYWQTLAIVQYRGCKIKQAPIEFDAKRFYVKTIGFSDESENSKSNYSEVRIENFVLKLQDNHIFVTDTSFENFENFISYEIVVSEQYKSIEDADKSVFILANRISQSDECRELPKNLDKQDFVVFDFSEQPYNTVAVLSEKGDEKEYSKQLLRQFWQKKDSADYYNIDCAVSPSLYSNRLGEYDILTVSFDDILYKDLTANEISSERSTEAAYNFMNSIRDFYNTGNVYYILPDYVEDFSLGVIRSSANSVFTNANPISESIGAVFDFQQSEYFTKYDIKDGDFVCVIEKKDFDNKKVFSVTPICAKTKYTNEKQTEINLKNIKEIPGGIRWEHHPPFIVDKYDPDKVMEYITKGIEITEGYTKQNAVYIISSQASIQNANFTMSENYFLIDTPFDAARGVAFSVLLQRKIKNVPLWCEHLPVLQMTVIKNGQRKKINLTQGKTVLPVRGKAQRIDIGDIFTLSKNVKEYHFRLMRGEGDQIKYEAYLSNSAFPLKQDAICRLEMYYNYGQDQPFDLYFVPNGNSTFLRAKVEWKEIDESKFPIPNFPPKRQWEEFINWKDSVNNAARSLIEWEYKNFETIKDLQNFYLSKESNLRRYTVKLSKVPKRNKDNGAQFFYLNSHAGVLIKVYISSLKTQLEQDEIFGNEEFSFGFNSKKHENDENGNKIYKAIGVTKGKSLNSKLINKYVRSFRFPTMQLWNLRESLMNDNDIPSDFKTKVDEAKKALNFLLYDENVQNQQNLWNELFLFACVLHSDGLDLTSAFIEEKLQNNNLFVSINWKQDWKKIEQMCFQFGYCIGACDYPIQKDVFDWTLDFDNKKPELVSFKLQILTIALWRSEKLLKEINADKMEELFNRISDTIDFERGILDNEQEISSRKLNPLRSNLELLVALLRSRTFGKEYQDLFSPFNTKIQEMISKIEKIGEWLNASERRWHKGIKRDLYARQIKFDLSDSCSNEGFLDYLLKWLDGQNSSEMPKIESATDNYDGENSNESDDDD